MAEGGWESEDPTISVAARLPLVFVALVGVGIVVAFTGDVVDPVDPMIAPGIAAVAIRLIATACERDCILFCCSEGIGVPTDDWDAVAVLVVVVEDNEEEDVAVVLPLVLMDALVFGTVVVVSTTGGSGGFIT